MPRGLCIFYLLATFVTLCPLPLSAAPVVFIHDRVHIERDPVRRIQGQAQVSGRVVERGSGEGVAYAKLRIGVDGNEVVEWTDERGFYSARLHMREGPHLLTIDFEGSQELDAAHVEMADFDISKSAVSLTIAMASEIADTESELRADITATADREDLLPLSLAVYFGPIEQELQRIDTLTIDKQGLATLILDQQDLGRPGRKALEIRYAGSTEFDAAQTSRYLTITSTSSLSLTTDQEAYAYSETLVAQGRLKDGRGNGIEGVVVSLEIGGLSVADSKTDARGDYLVAIDTEEIGSGSFALQASFAPMPAYRQPSLSKPVRISIGERKPIPIVYTVAAFALTSLALLSFITLRTKPWKRWRGKRKPAAGPRKPVLDMDAPPPATGLAPGRRKLRSTISRAAYSDFHGRVHNVITAQGIANASVVVAAHHERDFRSDEAGRFAIDDLSDGEYKVTVGATGFVSEHFAVHMPHRGEFHDARVDLLPVREKIFSLYKYAVRRLLPDPGLWGIWTPRQILDHVRESQPSERLSELTKFVEESFFSQRTPTEDKIELARAMIRVLDEEVTGPGPQP